MRSRGNKVVLVMVSVLVSSSLLCGDIHDAAGSGNLGRVKTLVEDGVDVNSQDGSDWTPLHRAAINGHTETAQLLLAQGAQIDARSEYGRTPLHLAAAGGQVEVAELLLSQGAQVDAQNGDNETPLHWAAHNGHIETVQLLRSQGAQVDAQNGDNETPLHRAADNGHTETVQLLLAQGAQVDAQNRWNGTPLHWAALQGGNEMALFLLEYGANPYCGAKLSEQHSLTQWLRSEHPRLLHTIVKRDHCQVVKYLLEIGFSAASKDGNERLPIWYAEGKELCLRKELGMPNVLARLIGEFTGATQTIKLLQGS